MVKEFFTVAARGPPDHEFSCDERMLRRRPAALPGLRRWVTMWASAAKSRLRPQPASSTSRAGTPMARPHIRCADHSARPSHQRDARGVHRSAPANFDSSKHHAAKQKFAREFAHRQNRAGQFNAMVTGFAATLALQRCMPAASIGAARDDNTIDTTLRLDNNPAPQSARWHNK